MRLRVLITTVIASLALAVALSGCGGSSGVVVAGPLARAAYITSSVKGAHMQLTAKVEAGSLLPQPITMSGAGYFNFAGREGTLSMQMTGLPESALGSGTLTMQEILKGSDVYVGSPLLAGKLPGGASWMKIDISQAAKAAGLDPTQLLQGQANPAQFLEYLKATGSAVTVVGHEPVRGVPTTHYTGEIDLAKMASALGASSADIQKAIGQLGLSKLPVDVWVDSHNLVRRLELNLNAGAGGQSMHMQMTIELFDFGSTPPVTAPPASQTFEATGSALGGLGSASQ